MRNNRFIAGAAVAPLDIFFTWPLQTFFRQVEPHSHQYPFVTSAA
jgi:hypothetical protein